MIVDIPLPNEALAALLISSRMHEIVSELGHIAQLLFQVEVAKRTGRLAAAARVETGIGGKDHDRWVSHMVVGGQGAAGEVDYGAAHQFGHWQDESNVIGSDTAPGESTVFVGGSHDLNRVLEQLGSL